MNVLLDMLRRVDRAGGIMVWEAPLDEQQWRVESSLLMECENGPTPKEPNRRPLLKLTETVVTQAGAREPLGLLKHAKVTLLQAGKDVLEKYPHG